MTTDTSQDGGGLGGLWQAVGDGRYVGHRPSRRYPIYTRGNVGEVFPDVALPLSFSLTMARGNAAFLQAGMATKVIDERDVAGEEAAAFGVFGGYAYLNLSYLRLFAVRSPGWTVADIDHQYVGTAPAPPYEARKGDKRLGRSLASLRATWRTVRATALPQLDADEARLDRWKAGLPATATATDAQLVGLVDDWAALFDELFEHHLEVSGQAIVAGAVLKLCERKLGDAAIGLRMITGLGDVASAAPAGELWALGRLVAGDAALTTAFEHGVKGLWPRLCAEEGASDFCARFTTFLERFGSRGPNEWETLAPTWGTAPELALALVDRMRLAPEDASPARAHARLVADRVAAVAEANDRLRWFDRRMLARLLRSSTLHLQGRERAKTTVVAAVHECRLALWELARRASERARQAGAGDTRPDDLWFVVRDELDAYLAEPAAFAGPVAERRAMRDELARREPPFAFSGSQPPPGEWLLRERPADEAARAAPGAVLTGIAGAPGVARGRARVVHHPGDPDALAPGDVLVAPITDPAWTPLFVPAAAVVVDVGALLSHAVIVARELGIPAVVSATDATRRIPDGALVEVDGNRGLVTVLEEA